MASRIDLQTDLEKIVKHVYYQPPESIKINYPCIIYNWSNDRDIHADDETYIHSRVYEVTIIDANPDSEIPAKFKKTFRYARLNRNYPADGLHHFVYTLYY